MERAMLVTRRTVILKCHLVPHQSRRFHSNWSDRHKTCPRREEWKHSGCRKDSRRHNTSGVVSLPAFSCPHHLTTRAPGSSIFKEKMSLLARKASWRHQMRQHRTMGASAPAPCPFHLAGCFDRDSQIFTFLWSMAMSSLKDSFSLLIIWCFWVACTFDLGHCCYAWPHKMSK